MLLQAVDDHRAQIAGVAELAQNDIGSYATSIIGEDPARVAVQLRAATPAVINQYGEIAGVSGALFYETQRPTPGFTADLVTVPNSQKVTSALGWALVPLFRPDEFELGAAETVNRLNGVVQGFVADQDRLTIRNAAKHDITSTGVKTFAKAGACSFCALMSAQATRGGHWHNHCTCVEVPTWQDAPAPFDEVQKQHSEAFWGAVAHLEAARYSHPDWARMSPRHFLKAHPELSLTNKNITRVMRAEFGFAH